MLGETCNVSEACRRSKVPMTVVYRRRKMDAAFRAEWIETIGEAYHRSSCYCSSAPSMGPSGSLLVATDQRSGCANIRTISR